MKSKNQILRELINFYSNGNKSDFARKLGVTPQGINTWLLRDTFDTDLIYSKCDNLSGDWLLTGEGEMLKTNEEKTENFSQKNVNPECKPRMKAQGGEMKAQNVSPKQDCKQIDLGSMIYTDSPAGIPLITADAMAGYLTGGDTQVMDYECEHYIVPAFKGADFLIPVRGDSMMPKYIRGDIVACKKLPLDTFFQWNKVYVVDTTQGILIKRVRKGGDNDHLLFVSENSEFEPFELHKKEVRGLAIVVGIIRRE